MNTTQNNFRITLMETKNDDERRYKRAAISPPEHMDMRDFLDPETYHRFDTIRSYLEDVSVRHEFVSLIKLGKTVEGREILGLKIGESRYGADTRSVMIDG